MMRRWSRSGCLRNKSGTAAFITSSKRSAADAGIPYHVFAVPEERKKKQILVSMIQKQASGIYTFVHVVDAIQVVVLCVPAERREQHAHVEHRIRHTRD